MLDPELRVSLERGKYDALTYHHTWYDALTIIWYDALTIASGGCSFLFNTISTTVRVVTTYRAALPRNMSPRWNKQREISLFGVHLCSMSLSEAAGHLSFVFLGMGFLETELLPLRVYAAAGIFYALGWGF